MKRLFGALLFLTVVLLLPWSRWEVQIDWAITHLSFIIGAACILGVIAVYIEVAVSGLRALKHQPPAREE